MSERARSCFLSIPGCDVDYFPLPGKSPFSVMFPRRVFLPPPDVRIGTPISEPVPGEAFQASGRPCKKCGRFRGVTFQSEPFSGPKDVVVAGVHLDTGRTGMMVWIACDAVVEAIERDRLTGWWIHKNTYA